MWSHVPVSPADLPGSLGLGESLRVSPSLSESHFGLEHPGRDLLARARLGLSLRTGSVTKTLFFFIISTEVDPGLQDRGFARTEIGDL